MPAKTKLTVASLSDQIKDLLVDRIVTGTLQPGDRLIELSIAQEVGTSQAPVREALRQLEGLGLIAFRRNRGAVVRKYSREERREIYAVRAELEGFAAAIVAASDPDVGTQLLSLCVQMERAADPVAFVDLNTAFHRLIVEACGNQALRDIWERLDVQTRTRINTAQDAEHLDAAQADHRKIAEAIATGRAQDARSLMTAHINAVVEGP
ncbi:GntR family transcriptional regulator [Tateyamaria sp. SN6-1]|uniref:GntR family transcriptional regulator n=1 Tax=Tateyamaria sp. SN6-1 TaxID=3092148 RepID=UPI0039F6102F